jgi:hypothetical protein
VIGVRSITRTYLVVTDLFTPGPFLVIGRGERLTGAPRVSLQGLSTPFTSVVNSLTAVIGSFGHWTMLDNECS